MQSRASMAMRLGWLLLLGGVIFAGPLGAAWPYVTAAGAVLIALRAAVALASLLGL